MNPQNCYIKFDFSEDVNFNDLKSVFEKLKTSRNNAIQRDDQYWLNSFPEYAVTKYTFLDSDIKPDYKTAEPSDNNWHFYSLIELLYVHYEIESIDIRLLSSNTGVLEYDPYSYPYGGVDGLITLVKSFNCIPQITDDGTGLYQIHFDPSGAYNLIEI